MSRDERAIVAEASENQLGAFEPQLLMASPPPLPAPPRDTAIVTRRERLTALGWLAAWVGLLVWLKSPWRPFLPPCVFRQATGHLCPGCGSTRMVERLLAGDIWQAFLFNPLAFLCLPLVLWVILRWCALAFGHRLREPRSPTWAFPALPILIVAYWIARNFVDNPAQEP